MLFQAAVTCATAGEKVLYICPKRLEELPCHVHGMPPALHRNSQHIKFMYFSKLNDVLSFLAAIHTEKILPGMVVMDDLHMYVGQGENTLDDGLEYETAKLFAMLVDAASYCTSKRKTPCYLLAASQEVQQDLPLFDVAKQFFSLTWTITKESEDLQTPTFCMSTEQYSTRMSILFYLDKDELFLDRVEEI